MAAGEGAAVASIVRTFPGTVVERWAQDGGWTQRPSGLGVCVTCGGSTVQVNPNGEPDHFRHYQNDGRPAR